MIGGKWNRARVSIFILVALLIGCGHAEESRRTAKFLFGHDTIGDVKDNNYVSPNNKFRILIPEFLGQGLKINDGELSAGIWQISMRDILCREYIVLENLFGSDDKSVDAWVDRKLMPMFKDPKYTLLERKYVKTRYGQGVLLRWNQREASPCADINPQEIKRVPTKADAEVGYYVIQVGEYAYRFIYVKGLDFGDEYKGNKRGPTEEVLINFIEGFEIIKTY